MLQILRDPRFDDLSGEFRPEVFSQTYKFIGDIRQREVQVCLELQESGLSAYRTVSILLYCFFIPFILQMVKKKLKKVKSDAKKQELKSLLKRMAS